MWSLAVLCLLVVGVTSTVINVQIPEEVPAGTFVYQLGFGGTYRSYKVNEPYFAVSENGLITTKARIDRESPPFNDPSNPYVLEVTYSGSIVRLIVTVVDINDNKPVFKSRRETFNFNENTRVGYEKYLPDAPDGDYEINATQGYRIVSGNTGNTFDIVSFSTPSKRLYHLRLLKPLDRELVSEYELEVEAYDGGQPPLTDTLTIRIIVDDDNDNSPEFNQTRYFATVPENAGVGYNVITVKATDRDAGSNGNVVYSFDRDFAGDNKFMIHKRTGKITLQGQLDYEQESDMLLRVVATDEGIRPLSDRAFVSITVADVNDNEPRIEILYNSATDTEAYVDEDTPERSLVVSIRVTDADDGEAGRVTCEMDSAGSGMDYFELIQNNDIPDHWNVLVKKSPRREVAEEYTLSITARDHGSPEQKVSFTTIKVKVVDVNNEHPVFNPPSYAVSLAENLPPGSDLVRVTATDADDGLFGEITYQIKAVTVATSESDPMEWFVISKTDGWIRNLVKLDREKTPEIKIEVQALDGGDPPFIGATTVIITLLDENDNVPLFSQETYLANVKNYASIGKIVTKVLARDYDDGIYGGVEYSLGPSPSQAALFAIQPTTGQISVAQPLPDTDYLLVPLTVIATDGGGLKGSCQVEVSIFGDNNYSPVFENTEYTETVSENELPPKTLLTLLAKDNDILYFGQIHYELVGSGHGKFSVDKETGDLRLINRLDYEKRQSYRLEVRAFNNFDGLQEREDRAIVTIIVNDVNDEPPQFKHNRYNLTAYAGDDNGTIINVIKAEDPDSASDDKITYRITHGNEKNLFLVRSTAAGAEIRINGNLRYLIGQQVNLVLEAQDGDPARTNIDKTILWISVVEGVGPGIFETTVSSKGWLNKYLPIIICVIVFLSLVFIVTIVVMCNRAHRQRRAYHPTKLPPYEGAFDYTDFDDQVGFEPDTVKAYNIDGGGECDRLSAFEALTSQLQSMQFEYMEKPNKSYSNFYNNVGYEGSATKAAPGKKGTQFDSEGYFSGSLSDPAFIDNEAAAKRPVPGEGYPDRCETINSLLNNQNIYTNLPQPVKCDSKDAFCDQDEEPPLRGATNPHLPAAALAEEPQLRGAALAEDSRDQDFVRSLPPQLENSFLPMSREPSPPPEVATSHSSLLSSHSRPEISRLPTSLIDTQRDHSPPEEGAVPGTRNTASHCSLNSDY